MKKLSLLSILLLSSCSSYRNYFLAPTPHPEVSDYKQIEVFKNFDQTSHIEALCAIKTQKSMDDFVAWEEELQKSAQECGANAIVLNSEFLKKTFRTKLQSQDSLYNNRSDDETWGLGIRVKQLAPSISDLQRKEMITDIQMDRIHGFEDKLKLFSSNKIYRSKAENLFLNDLLARAAAQGKSCNPKIIKLLLDYQSRILDFDTNLPRDVEIDYEAMFLCDDALATSFSDVIDTLSFIRNFSDFAEKKLKKIQLDKFAPHKLKNLEVLVDLILKEIKNSCNSKNIFICKFRSPYLKHKRRIFELNSGLHKKRKAFLK